jgi:hypothetical protein
VNTLVINTKLKPTCISAPLSAYIGPPIIPRKNKILVGFGMHCEELCCISAVYCSVKK